jgi:hypothetical protein
MGYEAVGAGHPPYSTVCTVLVAGVKWLCSNTPALQTMVPV